MKRIDANQCTIYRYKCTDWNSKPTGKEAYVLILIYLHSNGKKITIRSILLHRNCAMNLDEVKI